ncbi:MAG: 30S ribosomal protein S21 [Candidatus Magasanikbacteria bacterium]|nr:30S ribosomal protein S21 [Candidatus Magasanikbacteria bacterium]
MIEVKKRKNESFESLMRRFRKQVQQSGTMLQAKKVQYRKSHKSKNTVRASTLTRLKRKGTMEYLEKIGKTPSEK